MAASSGRIPQLDGWRGVSILLVILGHAVNFRFAEYSEVDVTNVLSKWGVDIFFVISGFIITKLAVEERRKTGTFSVTNFYVRRVFRIIPPFLLYLTSVAVLAHYGAIDHHQADTITAATFACNLPNANCNWFVEHTWSLAYEEQFYLLFAPLFAICVAPLRRAVLMLLAALLFLPFAKFALGAEWLRSSAAMAPSFSFICVGSAIAIHEQTFGRVAASRLSLPISVAAFALWGGLLVTNGSMNFGVANKIAYLQAAATTLVLPLCMGWVVCSTTVRQGMLGRALALPPIVFIGRISYSLYLWQQLFLASSSHYQGTRDLFNPAIMIAAAVLSFYAVERPMIRAGRRICAYLQSMTAGGLRRRSTFG